MANTKTDALTEKSVQTARNYTGGKLSFLTRRADSAAGCIYR